MTTALEEGEWSAARPGRTLPPVKTRYPLYRRLSGSQGRTGRAENVAPPGFDPRTFQPLVSRYTDWATRPTWIVSILLIYFQQDARCNTTQFIYFWKTALHVSGGISIHHQEHTQPYLQFLVFVKPLLLPAAIVEGLELVWAWCGNCIDLFWCGCDHCISYTCVTWQGTNCKPPEDDTVVSNYLGGVW